jgi:hypothetical protein
MYVCRLDDDSSNAPNGRLEQVMFFISKWHLRMIFTSAILVVINFFSTDDLSHFDPWICFGMK